MKRLHVGSLHPRSFWKAEMLARLYRDQYPEWTDEQVQLAALRLSALQLGMLREEDNRAARVRAWEIPVGAVVDGRDDHLQEG